MDVGWTRGLACSLLFAGCGFSASATPSDAIDASPDTIDAAPLMPYWTVVAMSRGATPLLDVLPFDGVQFTTRCPEQAATYFIRDLVSHASLRVIYSVDTGFHSLVPTCGTMTQTGTNDVGGARPIQQIAHDPASNVGFFTMDSAGAIGVFRFTTAPDGTPTVTTSANATSAAGPLALDAPGSNLFVAGPVIVGGYALVGSQLDLPATFVSASMCNEPVRLLLTGTNSLLAFCSDSPDIRRYKRTPFESDGMVGALGPVDQVVGLPQDRAVAAREAPLSDLVVVSLNGGAPTWAAGPPIPSRVLAMAASQDGKLVVTARVDGPAASELAVWRVDGDVISLVDVTKVDAVVTALAITTPGS